MFAYSTVKDKARRLRASSWSRMSGGYLAAKNIKSACNDLRGVGALGVGLDEGRSTIHGGHTYSKLSSHMLWSQVLKNGHDDAG